MRACVTCCFFCRTHRLSQTLARGITKAGVATEMVDLMSVDAQELVEVVGRNSGVVLMAPPSDNPEAQTALATLLSSLKPKQKVPSPPECIAAQLGSRPPGGC